MDRRARKAPVLLLCAALAGCAAAPTTPVAELLHDGLFAPASVPMRAKDVFAMSDAMRRYLDAELGDDIRSKGPRQALLDAVSRGQLKLEYDAAVTRNAAETFDAKAGNCLSLVIMTAAFAKELELPVEYRVALFDDMWSRSGNVYFLNGHVNLTLGKRESQWRSIYDAAGTMTIDFLPGQELRGLRTVAVEEPTLVAMFMANRSAEALVAGRIDDAYWWAREALRHAPDFLAAYNTLGVVYLRRGQPGPAERAFREVLAREPRNTRALANLALVLGRQGREAEAAAAYAELVRIEGHAPFHFFHFGLAAMEAGDFKSARELFAKEVARAPQYHEFRFWLGLAYLRLGDLAAARRELAAAVESSTTQRDHDLYATKLYRLKSQAPR